MPVDATTLQRHSERISRALRTKSWRDVHVVSEHDPSISLKFEVAPGMIRATVDVDGADMRHIIALGWRPPNDVEPLWYQYFYPQRGRERRLIGGWALQTLVDAFGCSPEVFILRGESSSQPWLERADRDSDPLDTKLADCAEHVLDTAPFSFQRDGTHFAVISRRPRHVAQLALGFCQGTLSARVLHLVCPNEETVCSHLAVNPALGNCPYVYTMDWLCDGREVLALQTKTAVPRYATFGPAMGGVLAGTIEPLLAAHHHLHSHAP